MINLLANRKEINTEQLRVVIIDDCSVIRKKLQEFISENTPAYVVGQAENVKESLRVFALQTPDIVFLDINLPDGNGMEVLSYLKKVKPEVKVVIISNAINDVYKRKFEEKGSDYVLDKSKDFIRIPEIISDISVSLKMGKA